MTDARFSAEPVLNGLMDFQRNTVEHMFSTLHEEGGSGRFLVADETGLGKSIVARGLVAKTIEHLQDADDVGRIDIVYVCSNMDLARQNIGRLNVTAEEEVAFSSRLTLLGKHSTRLNSRAGRSTVNGKLINLVSFTPSTSFDPGQTMGQASERALLVLAMKHILDLDDYEVEWATRLLQGGVSSVQNMRDRVSRMRSELPDGIDPHVLSAFATLGTAAPSTGTQPSLCRFRQILDDVMRLNDTPTEVMRRVWPAVGHLRRDLAKAGIKTLEPDLIILDEFQRFRALLDRSTDAGELADTLFSEETAKVVLLSATPYKPFTYAEEEEDHAQDFLNTIRFLHDESVEVSPRTDAVSDALADYRRHVTTGMNAAAPAETASQLLLQVMSRNERPLIEERSMLEEHIEAANDLTADDLASYVRLKELATLVDPRTSLVGIDYWKSAPYFLTFSNGYRLRQRIKEKVNDPNPELRSALLATRHLTKRQVDAREPIDLGNARLRRLATQFLDTGAWQLLWMPPSLPYLEPEGVYAGRDIATLTKRLIFSSWAATPASVASLLSYEVNRRMFTTDAATAESVRGQLLNYRGISESGRPQSMTTLMLFWPMPGLATMTDPRAHTRMHGCATSSTLLLESHSAIADTFSRPARALDPEDDNARRVWHAALAHLSNWPSTTSGERAMVNAMSPSAKATTIERQRQEQDGRKASELYDSTSSTHAA